MAAKTTNAPVIVTGSPRSGTTWVGRVLATAPRTRLVHEPFNLALVGRRRPFDPKVWFLRVDDTSPLEQRREVAATVRRIGYTRRVPAPGARSGDAAQSAWLRALGWSSVAFSWLRNDRVIYKDPLAFFATEWLHDELGMQPVVMVRHPAAFASSLKLKKWKDDFHHFTAQPRLMELLASYRDDIERCAAEPPSVVEQAALLWNCIYSVAWDWRNTKPDWLFVRHEDLSRDPVAAFRPLFARLDLEFGARQISYIEEVSGVGNPSEQTADEFRRNSHANIDNWKRRLSAKEIDLVMARTEDVRRKFYRDDREDVDPLGA